ncbi:MAG: transglycosylase SLT domain-containing protein [Bdellovibrionales bacterium]
MKAKIYNKKNLSFWLSIFVLLSGPFANSESIKLSSNDTIPFTRWKYDPRSKFTGGENVKPLAELKMALRDKKYAPCLKAADVAWARTPSLRPWILVARFDCHALNNFVDDGGIQKSSHLVESHSEWLLNGPYSGVLKTKMVEANFGRLDYQLRRDRNRAEKILEALLKRLDWMDGSQKARVFRYAGELAFMRQRLRAALGYYRRSLTEKETSEIRDKVKSILSLLKEKEPELSKPSEVTIIEKNLEASPKEREYADRMANALKTGDLISAVEDGVEIIETYPGGQRAKWAADRIYEVFASISSKSEPSFQALKKRILKEMESVDGMRIYNWCEKAFRQGYYEDVAYLAKVALRKLKGTSYTTKLLSWAAHSELYTGHDDEARKLFQDLLQNYAGTEESVRALFRLGLIDFRRKDYISSAAQFERLLVFPDADKFEMQANYWLWRSLQKIDELKGKKAGQDLVERFPLTYYGLRTQAEMGDGKVNIQTKDAVITEEIELAPAEEKAWARIQLLLKAGWFEESQAELKNFYEPVNSRTRVLMARIWAAAMDYPTALNLISKAWDEDLFSTMITPIVKVAYPLEFSTYIEETTKKNGLEPALIRALIRQESSFSPVAVSPANAQGLMQLLPGTADEMAQEINLKGKRNYDIFDPSTNIQLGSRYLRNMIKKYSGNVAFALAAYNAGPGRFDKWMKARNLSPATAVDPLSETWIDEMPWSETSFYVKAILRNLIIYRILDRGPVTLPSPVWVAEAK